MAAEARASSEITQLIREHLQALHQLVSRYEVERTLRGTTMAVEASLSFPPLASARPVELRASRAAERTELDAKDIERLPFDLSVLDAEGVFIVRRITRG